jgi:hypothetical protein
MMLWRTNTNGTARCVRLTEKLAIKTPYIFFDRIKTFWFLNIFRRFWLGLMSNREEVRRYRERGHLEFNGIRFCPVKSYLWGLITVMPKVEPLPLETWNPDDHSFQEFRKVVPIIEAGGSLMGFEADNIKHDSYGLLDGKIVMIDYGWWMPKAAYEAIERQIEEIRRGND